MDAPESQILIYQPEGGRARIDVRLEGETVWLTQSQMVELFQTTKQNISLHLRNIFREEELREDSVVKHYLTTAADGKKPYYLDDLREAAKTLDRKRPKGRAKQPTKSPRRKG